MVRYVAVGLFLLSVSSAFGQSSAIRDWYVDFKRATKEARIATELNRSGWGADSIKEFDRLISVIVAAGEREPSVKTYSSWCLGALKFARQGVDAQRRDRSLALSLIQQAERDGEHCFLQSTRRS